MGADGSVIDRIDVGNTNIDCSLTSPAPSSTLTSSTVTFEWSSCGADLYALYIGSAQGGYDIYYEYTESSNTSVSGLPTDGSTIYVRFWYSTGDEWNYEDYTYTAYTDTCDYCDINGGGSVTPQDLQAWRIKCRSQFPPRSNNKMYEFYMDKANTSMDEAQYYFDAAMKELE